jgi:hypothetical protein
LNEIDNDDGSRFIVDQVAANIQPPIEIDSNKTHRQDLEWPAANPQPLIEVKENSEGNTSQTAQNLRDLLNLNYMLDMDLSRILDITI